MSLTLSKSSARDIIVRLLTGRNYREVVIILINEEFVGIALPFLRRVAKAKVDGGKISEDWYKAELLRADLPSSDFATNAGMNMKTVTNTRQTQARAVVQEMSLENYQQMRELVDELADLCEGDGPFDMSLKLQAGGNVTAALTLNETMLVINALAVKRAAIRGGFWGTAGKRVEKPLMETLCRLFSVKEKHYRIKSKSKKSVSFNREVDFYLVAGDGQEKRCEVKLMGRGNPESADVIYPRDSDLFVADKLSGVNKQQAEHYGVAWVELHGGDRFDRFAAALDKFGIPREKNPDTSKAAIVKAVDAMLKKN